MFDTYGKKENDMGKRYIIIKNVIDFTFSLIALIILLPFFCIFAIIIKLESKGPVFFKQKRIGKNGKTFKMYKYRSMVVNADKKLRRHLLDNPEANEEFLKYRKLKDNKNIE